MTPQKRKDWLKTGVLVGLFVIVMNWQSLSERARGAVDYDRSVAGPVTLFSTEWCGYCKKTRYFLNQHDIPFRERDIEASTAAMDAFRRLGGSGVPVVQVGDKVVHGYSLARLRTALECPSCERTKTASGDANGR
jgi:glutaredoxin